MTHHTNSSKLSLIKPGVVKSSSSNKPFTHGISRRKILSTIALGSAALGAAVLEIKSGSGLRVLSIPSRLLEGEVAGSANAQQDPGTTVISSPPPNIADTFFIPLATAGVEVADVGFTVFYNAAGELSGGSLRYSPIGAVSGGASLSLTDVPSYRVGVVDYLERDGVVVPVLTPSVRRFDGNYETPLSPMRSAPAYVGPRQVLSAEQTSVLTYLPVVTEIRGNYYFVGLMLGQPVQTFSEEDDAVVNGWKWNYQHFFGTEPGDDLFYVQENEGGDPTRVKIAGIATSVTGLGIAEGEISGGVTNAGFGSAPLIVNLVDPDDASPGITPESLVLDDIADVIAGIEESNPIATIAPPTQFPTTPFSTMPWPTMPWPTTPWPTTPWPTTPWPTTPWPTTPWPTTLGATIAATTTRNSTTMAATTTGGPTLVSPAIAGELSFSGAMNAQANAGRNVARSLSGRLSNFRSRNRLGN